VGRGSTCINAATNHAMVQVGLPLPNCSIAVQVRRITLRQRAGLNPLGLPASLRRCLGTTNLIDNSHSTLRERTHRPKWVDFSGATEIG
jgi:hypothetical protein